MDGGRTSRWWQRFGKSVPATLALYNECQRGKTACLDGRKLVHHGELDVLYERVESLQVSGQVKGGRVGYDVTSLRLARLGKRCYVGFVCIVQSFATSCSHPAVLLTLQLKTNHSSGVSASAYL
jgi:hypothetical protein